MKKIPHIFRGIYEENLLLNKRWLFGTETAPAPQEAEAEEPEKKENRAEATQAEPLSPQSWEDHEAKYETHIAGLPEGHKDIDGFKDRMNALKAEYEASLETLTKDRAAQTLSSAVDTILHGISSHAEYSAPAQEVAAAPVEGAVENPEQQTAGPAGVEKKEETEVGTEITGETLNKTLGIVAKMLKITDQGVMDKVNTVLKTMKFSKDQLLQIEKGQLELSKEQKTQLIQAFSIKIEAYDDKEGNHIETFLEGLYEEGGKTEQLSQLENLFDDADDPMRVYLSRTYKIEPNGKALIFTKPGEDPITVSTVGEFTKMLEPSSQNLLTEMMKTGKTKAEIGTQFDALQAAGKEQLATLKGIEALQKVLIQSQSAEKTGGTLEAFTMLMKLFASIKQAFETGDWDTLGDFLNDWTETKNPKELAKRLEDSKEAYKKALENPESPPTLTQLVKGYLKPRGPEADEMFRPAGMTDKEFKASPAGKYRMEAQPFIREYIQRELGLNSVSDITDLNGTTEITAYNSKGNPISIELNLSGEKPKGRIVEHVQEENEQREKVWTKPTSNAEFVETSMEDLKTKIAGEGGQTEQVADQQSQDQPDQQQETPEPTLYKAGDTPPRGEEVQRAIKAVAGKWDEFVDAYKAAAKTKGFNAAKWQLEWMIDNKIPKPKQGTA